MPLPLRDFVQQVLLEKSRAAKIHRAVHRAWKHAVDTYPERGGWIRKASFRGLVWEVAVRELETIGRDDPDFRFVPHRDTVSFVIEDEVLIRFKHADISLSTSTYPTPEAVAFDSHDVDLYGFKGLQRVELCYVTNEFETELVWVGIAARSNGNHLWKIELSDEGVLAPPAQFPAFEEDHDTAKLAKVKPSQPVRDAKKKKDNE